MDKQWLIDKLIGGLFGAVFSFLVGIVLIVIKGESLSGLSHLKGVSVFLRAPLIPVWLFAIITIGAALGWQQARKYRPRELPLHVVWNKNQSFWHMGSSAGQPAMQVMVEGAFTGRERDSIQVLHARLEGGNTEVDLMMPVICPENATVPERLMFFVKPPIAKQGQAWTGRIILTDQYNREHKTPKITLTNK